MLVCLPLAASIGLSPLHILTLCGSERVLVVSTEPLDDLPLPPSALCTVFGERGLPCPVTSPCVSLSPCPVSFGLARGGGTSKHTHTHTHTDTRVQITHTMVLDTQTSCTPIPRSLA